MIYLLALIAFSFFSFFKILTWGTWQVVDLLLAGHLIYAGFVIFWLAQRKYHHILWVPALILCALSSHYVNPQASLLSLLLFIGSFQIHRKPFAIVSATAGVSFLMHWMSYGIAFNSTQALIVTAMLFTPVYLLKLAPNFSSPLNSKDLVTLGICALLPVICAAMTQQIVLTFALVAGCCLLTLGFVAFHMDRNKKSLALKMALAYVIITYALFPVSAWVLQG